MKVSVILPSLNPDEKLMQVVYGLINEGFNDIIIVNDGSNQEHINPFLEAEALDECTVLTHDENKGKGRALKTAFTYFLNNRKDYDGVVTVDGDNQHRPEDIKNCCKQMMLNPHCVILGARDFSQDNVPARSRFGNNVTSFIFKTAVGLKISDTQTGLRVIPREYIENFIAVRGERFEYETNMLLEMKTYNIPFKEEKIKTVYIEENKTSHFNPLKDSFKIYSLIFKFLLSSVFSTVLDLVLFTVLNTLVFSPLGAVARKALSVALARIASSLCNFTLNRTKVFKNSGNLKQTFIKYYILCGIQMLVSIGLLNFVTNILNTNKFFDTVVFACINVILYFISFQIQREWVFKNKAKQGEKHVSRISQEQSN